jgi:hypothetical protein
MLRDIVHMLVQKLVGVAIILLTIAMIRWLGIQETGLYNGDIALVTFPIGLWLIFTRKIIVW